MARGSSEPLSEEEDEDFEEPSCSQDSEKESETEIGENIGKRTKDRNRYKCPHCDYHTPYSLRFKEHLSTHDNGRFRCEECGEHFDRYLQLRSHRSVVHPRIHKCSECNYSHKKPHMVQRHAFQMHDSGIPCTVKGCTATVAKNRLKRHLLEAHGNEKIFIQSPVARKKIKMVKQQCPFCSYETPEDCDPSLRGDDMNLHIKHAHEEGVLCTVDGCNEKILLGEFQAHVESVHGDERSNPNDPYLPEDFLRDLATVTDTATSSSALSSGIDDEHFFEDFSEEEECSDDDLNEKKGSNKLGKVHDSVGVFECLKCRKLFMSSMKLKRHVRRVHEKAYAECKESSRNKKRYDCGFMTESGKVCGKSFASPTLLQDHMNLHSGVKPYSCVQCSQSFHARARFAVHLSKYHQTSIKNYESVAALLPKL
ncbi:unnamed protein product [Caenorhabditis auriculariae]|uniref:C2H2-type domain-containing protein n=1 Tax=Caenorhabditis auriculariae TaxID=2777116 RepID=A0A8S1HSC2_9PELO|nr:unnamed protein product [Caenorhabditis auriculariae]